MLVKISSRLSNQRRKVYWETINSIVVYILLQGATRSSLVITIFSTMVFFHEFQQLDVSIEFWIVTLELITKTFLFGGSDLPTSNLKTPNATQSSGILTNAFILTLLSQNSSITRSNFVNI
jgi:hypothetical protein